MKVFKRLQEQAYDYLKEMILTDQFSIDEIYSESKIADELGISRTPIRDALQRLSQDGYIDIMPSKGFRLHKISQTDVIETFQVRSAIEGYCAYTITKQNDTELGKQILDILATNLLEQQQIFATTANIDDFLKKDNMFHMHIVSFLNNNDLTNMFSSYMYRIKNLAKESLAHQGRMHSTLQEHIKIFETMKAGATTEIYPVMMSHMENPKYINLQSLIS